MTSKELATVLKVSKRTINNKIQKLKIEPKIIGNKYDISQEDAEKIIKNIYKDDYLEFITAIKEYYPTTSKTIDILSENEKNENIKENNENENKQSENENKNNAQNIEQNENKTEQSEHDITDKLIKMLEKSLEDKEQTIRAQQNQIDMLIKSNAMLTQRLEDKQQKKDDIIITEQPQAAADRELSWWQKLFSGSSKHIKES